MLIREIQTEDAEKFISLIKKVESQADFMLMGAGERKTTPEQQRKQIEQIKQQSNSTIFVVEEQRRLVGYLVVIGGRVNRTKHSAYLVIGILEEYRGQGIGKRLFQSLEEWAKNKNISRLELSVVTQNEAALALYRKSGFEIEGIKRNSLMINHELYNEYFMAKLV